MTISNKIFSKSTYSLLFIVNFCILANSVSADTPRLPVEAFANLPDVRQVILSPNGKMVASIVRADLDDIKGSIILLLDIETFKTTPMARSDDTDFVIQNIRWSNDNILLITARFPAMRYGTPTTETRLLRLDVQTGELKPLINKTYIRRYDRVPQFQNHIVDFLESDDDHILLGLATEKAGEERVYRVNVENGKQKLIQRSKKLVNSWMTDRQERIRVGIYQNENNIQILVKNLETSDWETKWEYEVFSEEAVTPLGFDYDPNILYLRKYHQGKEAIFSTNLQNESGELTLVYSDYDVQGNIFYSNVEKQVVGTTYSSEGGFSFWNDKFEAFQRGINKALPDTENYIISLSDDERRYIVLATSDTNPGTYYYGDRDKGALELLARRYSKLPVEFMRPKNSSTYSSRDGLEINAFLTLPNDEKVSHPTIIFPHGGPISYDDGGFDYWTQFFANRGYAVLQMNFRGSDGYGYDFMQAGLQNWGQEMQDDVEDGARWLIEHGIADKDRMCIVGASYGGYAALMGAVKTPDLYKCVISFAGIGDVVDLVRSHRRYLHYDVVKSQIGDDFGLLRENSPVEYADKFQAPVLLIHGTKDRSVKVQQSREMHKVLLRNDKNVSYLELEDGDHYLSNSQQRVEAFTTMDEFLKKHLPVDNASPQIN